MLQGSSILILFVKLATILNLSDPALLMMSPNLHNTLLTLASDLCPHLNVPPSCLSDIMTTLWRLGTAWLFRPPGALVSSSGMISASSL